MRTRIAGWATLLVAGASACMPPQGGGGTGGAREERPRPSVEVLLADSVHLITARTLVVISDGFTSHGSGKSTARLLREDKRAQRAGVRVVGTVDSADLIVVDVQDDGSRSSAALHTLDSVLRQAAPKKTQVVLLDRPNPLTGQRVEGPTPPRDSANPEPVSADPADVLGLPMRHGLTLGEIARVLGERTAPEVPLAIVPVFGWRRSLWPNQTRLPATGDGSLALSRTALSPLVAIAGVDVGEGTDNAWRHVAAPWLDARAVLRLVEEREPAGIRFSTGNVSTSRRGRTLPAIRLSVIDRERVQPGRVAATLFWAMRRVHGDSVRVDTTRFDAAFGSPQARRALMSGTDPDEVMDRELTAAIAFSRDSRRVMLYR